MFCQIKARFARAAFLMRRAPFGTQRLAWLIGVLVLSGSIGALGVSRPRDVLDPDFVFDVWQARDGLPQNSATSIEQTPDGYLWIGTFNGLARYDGVRFVIYDEENTPALPSSRIVELHLDQRNRLWIISEFGDVTTWSGKSFQLFAPKENGRVVKVSNLVERKNGTFLFNDAAFIYRLEGESAKPLLDLKELGLGRVLKIYADGDGVVWVALKQGFGVLEGSRFRRLLASTGDPNIPPVDEIAPCREGGVWVCEPSQGLARYERGEFKTRPLKWPVANLACKDLLEESNGSVWIASANQGLFQKTSAGEWKCYSSTNGLSSDFLRVLFQDAEKSLWAGTDGGGLDRLRERRVRMLPGPGANRIVTCVAEDKQGAIWRSIVNEGLFRQAKGGAVEALQAPFALDLKSVWTLWPAREDGIWVEDGLGGLLKWQQGGWSKIPNPTPLRTYLRAIYEDQAGGLWLGHLQGLTVFDGKSFTSLNERIGIANLDVRALTEGSDGTLYVASNGQGVLCGKSNRWTRISHSDGLSNDRIWSLHSGGDGTLWIGTFGGGLCYRKGNLVRRLDGPGGIPARVVSCILEDDLDQIWCGSIKGIFMASRQSLYAYGEGKAREVEYLQFDQSDGLSTMECSGGAQPTGWKSADGRLWFATIDGVAVIEPRALKKNPNPPQVWIEALLADYPTAPRGGLATTNLLEQRSSGGSDLHLRIPAETRNIEIQYTAPAFVTPEKVHFRYKFEGLDRDWVNVGNRRLATFSHLPHGKYTFHVAAANPDGVWNEAGATLRFEVLPFFWQTKWFRAIAAGTFLGLVFFVYRWRLAQMEAVNQLRLRIAGDLHDEIGANLGSIGLNTELLQNDPSLTPSQREELGEISQLAGQTGSAVRDIVWFTNPEFDNLAGMVRRMREVATLMLAGRQFSFEAPGGMENVTLSVEFRRNIFFMFKEALHNIVKHSGATRVLIRMNYENGNLTLTIEDNGRGFDIERSGSGSGLKNLRRRAGELGAELGIKTGAGQGTVISISAPVNKPAGKSIWFASRTASRKLGS